MSFDYTQLESRLAEACAAHKVPGASIAIWDGGQMHTAVYGQRNSVTGDPVTLDTVMHIGSITKALNTTLLMQLVDDGLVSLDDPVQKHLPNLKLADMQALGRITLRMLTNHTSGIDGMMIPDHGPDAERIEDAIARFADLGQLHEPGAGPSYCNAATVITGHLVQSLRGKSWYTLVKERIFQPLGLGHSLVDLTELPLYRVSVGDLVDASTGRMVQTTRPFLPLSFAPAGATAMMTATDLLNFGRAHLNGGLGVNGQRILSAESTALMQVATADIIEPKGWQWGLGWNLFPGGLVGHGGGGPGVASMLYLHPASGRGLAVLMNGETGFGAQADLMAPLLSDWTGMGGPGLAGDATPTLPEVRIDPAVYVGRFGNSIMWVDVERQGDGLTLRTGAAARVYDNTPTTEQEPATLQPLGDHLFGVSRPLPGLPAQAIRFVAPDATGRSPAVGFWVHLMMRQTTR